ncbi:MULTISPECIES: VWA domain-containing protein [unclassified Ruegeria]|uniref:vWA domain-containing protein n=1 Tax=unclassified Ruegeria TaxID=2625375 RepID=UPI0014930386|nr:MULTISPECIES: VWA domain-containing protein [unclassified Ruegeria]NOD87304.1 VWA domain-containing protein [Ruegeria sp. HKCCD4318]NOE12859.1 VWA domain-containing protein [Ruegeria sp. HKCCD4318-2]NOG08974.1 VWA domain-containing protein [Ruegeria sp. HKCCD4315]
MFSFAAPWVFVLLPLPALVYWLAPPHREKSSSIRIPFFRHVAKAAGVEPRSGSVIPRRAAFQTGTVVVIWCLLIFAMARPEKLGEPVVVEKSARDVVLALDISGSMDQRDFTSSDGAPTQRLAAVKDVLRQFIAERQGDRMALIIFGTRAFVQAPFTEDLNSLNGFLDQTQVGMAGPNTALGDAIGLGIRTFESSEVDQRLMIVLSDGADTSSRMTPVNAAAIAAEKGVVIYTVGVGDPDASGEDRVDLDALKDIADRTGGAYFFANDQDALAETYARIDELNPRIVETQSYRPRESLAHYPLGLVVVLMLMTLSVQHVARQRKGAA